MDKRKIKNIPGCENFEVFGLADPSSTQKIINMDSLGVKSLKPIFLKVYPADCDKEFDNGSHIFHFSPDKIKIENLKTLGLIWGFLKYYHPNIARGDYNWDYELFRVLPSIILSENKNDRDNKILKWINSLDNFEGGDELSIPKKEVKIKPDLDWIGNSGFSYELIETLIKIKNAVRTGEHYYIGMDPDVGNPEFKNENPYSSMTYPDIGFRILALFRYWNIIQYFFPYKNLIEEDWLKVLEEFIPKFVNAHNELAYSLVVLELTARIGDTHANTVCSIPVLRNFFGRNHAAVRLSFIENKAVVTELYEDIQINENILQVGDIISTVNHKTVEDIVKDILRMTPGSNYSVKLRDIAFNLLRTNDSKIDVEIIRNDKLISKTLRAYSPGEINFSGNSKLDNCFKLVGDIAYINNGTLKRKYLEKIWENIQNTKGLVIDIRNYPSDFPVYELCNYLIPESTPFVKFTKGSIFYPGLFTFTKSLRVGKNEKRTYTGTIVILVNELTQSSAEFHAMAYRVSPNAIVIGSTTAGADGNTSQFYLPGNIPSTISGIGVYYPDGTETQKCGIVPDLEVTPTINGIKNCRDELFEKATEIINTNLFEIPNKL